MRIISVEPNVESVLEIYSKIQQHNLQNRWFVEQCCVDLDSGFKQFGFHHSEGMCGRLNGSLDPFNWTTWNYEGTKGVRTKRIGEICRNPSIVKMDIERHEYVVLPEIVMLSSIKLMFIELHGPCYELDVHQYLADILRPTNLEVTGWFRMVQEQHGGADECVQVDPQAEIPQGEYMYVVVENTVGKTMPQTRQLIAGTAR